MRCFSFSDTDKEEETKTPKSVSIRSSSTSASTADHDARISLSASDISTGSSVGMSFTSMSHRQSNLRELTYEELRTATKNFSRSVMLGEGGFGGVYRGAMRDVDGSDKKIEIAVKQLSRRGLQGHKEWVTEVNVLGIVEHPNLVKLHGYCAEDDERGMQRLLVYEYLPNRSVLDHLSSRFQATLPWDTRLRVAEDAARGLTYLHEGMDFQIIFRDFKSSNILLDDQWKAKLSDFGLARLGPSDGVSHVSTAVVGTVGYAVPEYIQTGRLTSKSDVWSYGVFLYELITGRRPVDRNRPKHERRLLEWVRPHLSDPKKFEQVMDPRMNGKYCLNSAQKLAAIANRCLVRHPKNRPRMSEVLEAVSKVVEESCIGSPEWPLSSSLKESEEKSKAGELKKAFVELVEHKWLVQKIWRSKLVKATSQKCVKC